MIIAFLYLFIGASWYIYACNIAAKGKVPPGDPTMYDPEGYITVHIFLWWLSIFFYIKWLIKEKL